MSFAGEMAHQHPPYHPPTSQRPRDITERPDLHGSIYVETSTTHPSMPPPSSTDPLRPGHNASGSGSHSTNVNLSDVAGVLRRNQACLNCRRRKLKCDAVRPHCGTCVRSHRHHLKHTPGSDAVIACEYDDGTTNDDRAGSMGNEEEEYGEASKKKKKSINTKRKSRKDEEEEETERLRKKIEDLEAQLASQRVSSQPSSAAQPPMQQQWSNPQSAFGNVDVPAPSPTAFLEMLSSAATAHQDNAEPMAPGLRAGASENAMMSSTWAATPTDNMQSTGLTPFLSFADNQEASLASDVRPPPVPHRAETGQSEGMDSNVSRRSSAGGSISISDASPQIPQMPRGTTYSFLGAVGPNGENVNVNWMPAVGPEGLQPSTRTEGPWRGVETVSSVFGQQQVPVEPIAELSSQQADPMNDFNEAMQQQLLMDLFWPGWPQYLPEPNIVNDLVEAFFQQVPNMPRLLHRARFLSRLALPPTHSNFPHPALIHAVCAAAASWCPPAVYERSTRARWTDNPIANDKNMTFALRQAAYGKEAVQDGLNTGNRLFDVVRAMIVLSRVFIDDTRMLECWAYSGLVSRMLLPLGLNVRSAELSLKSVMLPPPSDALEREERRVTVWMAFYHDTIASSASGWGTSMQIDELTVPLPVAVKDFDLGTEDMPSNPQDLDSPDFWTRHPIEDPFVMCIKASVLLNRVNRFVRKWKNRHLREDDDFEGMQRPEFRELANAAACLQMSFPPGMRNPAKMTKKKLDIDLIAAHMIPQAAIICLYEPFADISDPNDGPARRILAAAQSIVLLIQNLASTTSDGVTNLSNVMHSSASVCLVTAARTSLLFYRLALNNHDQQTAESHRMDIETIKMSLQAFGMKFKIGHHHSQLIEYFLDRASRPDYQKLQAHYPTHPRPGAPELHPNADFGQCILNALNIKRGFWRRWGDITGNIGVSPFGSTPDTAAYASSLAGQASTTTSHSGSATDRSARISRISSDSPNGVAGNAVGDQSSGTYSSFSAHIISTSSPASPVLAHPCVANLANATSGKTGYSPPTYEQSKLPPPGSGLKGAMATYFDSYSTNPVSAPPNVEYQNFTPNGLRKDMEALFDGVEEVKNGQKYGISVMKAGGAMDGLTVPNLN